MSIADFSRVYLVELGLDLQQLVAYTLQACYDFLFVYHLLLACLEACACGLDGQPLLLYEVMYEAYEVDILLRVLAYARVGFLGVEGWDLLLPEA